MQRGNELDSASGGGKGAKGGMRPGRHCAGAAFEGAKICYSEFGRFWQIGVCIADSDILHP